MAKKKSSAAAEKAKLSVACSFKSVSFGSDTAKLGVNIGRDAMSLDDAEEYLCGRRSKVRIVARASADEPAQGRLSGMEAEDRVLVATVDIRGFGVKPKMFSTSLSFITDSVGEVGLEHFAGVKSGLVEFFTTEAIEVYDEDEDKDAA